MGKTIAVILNPVSGAAGLEGTIRRVAGRLKSDGFQFELLTTQGPGHAADLARSCARLADVIVIVGGDGTVREVVSGCLNLKTPLALYPAGTENILARYLGVLPHPHCLIQTLTNGRIRAMDVGRVNDMCFLTVVGAGFDAEAVARLVRSRGRHITHLSYFWPIWRTFWEYRFPTFHVTADGADVFHGPGMVFVGNMKRYAVGLRLLRDAVEDDGLLDLCVLPCRWQGKLLVHALNTLLLRHVEHGGVIYRQCARITVSASECVPLQADGDPAGSLPAEITVIPRAIRFILPPCGAAHPA